MNSIQIEKPKIIIVDDHVIFRHGIKSMLDIENIATVIGEASNGIEFIELLSHVKPDLVFMDIDMPYMNGLDATQNALKIFPDLKIIALTMFSDEEYYYKMIDRGVKGFLLKTSGISEIENAIRNVMLGETHFSNEILVKIISNYSHKNTETTAKLELVSEREKEILQLLCKGHSTEEISQKLFISPETVKKHKSNLFGKTDSKNTASLILFAIKNKIIDF